MNRNNISRWITLFGATGFVAIVAYLHVIQASYSPVHQLMSELALGHQGQWMLFAFLSLALSVAGAAGVLHSCHAGKFILLLLMLASACLVGAGVFKLGSATTLHVMLVALAFMLLGLAMYLVPRYVAAFQNQHSRIISWGLGIGTALAVVLGGGVLPAGIGQRVAAGCILVWLCWIAVCLFLKRNLMNSFDEYKKILEKAAIGELPNIISKDSECSVYVFRELYEEGLVSAMDASSLNAGPQYMNPRITFEGRERLADFHERSREASLQGKLKKAGLLFGGWVLGVISSVVASMIEKLI